MPLRRPGPVPRRRPQPDIRPPGQFVAECVAGLELFAAEELDHLGGVTRGPHPDVASPAGEVRFAYAGPWGALLKLRTIVAVGAVIAEGLARPSLLLDDGRFRQIEAAVGHIRS